MNKLKYILTAVILIALLPLTANAQDKMPSPVGGIKAIMENLVYPEEAKEAGTEGKVFVKFVVNTDGSVSDVSVKKGIGKSCDEAAMAAVRNTKFTPAIKGGRKVSVELVLPILFKLDDKKS